MRSHPESASHRVKGVNLSNRLFAAPCPMPPLHLKLPNLVFILADDLGYHDTTLYLEKRPRRGEHSAHFFETPNLQRLARSGLRFTNAYAHSLCSPSRAAILTGLEPARMGFVQASGHVSPARLLPGFRCSPADRPSCNVLSVNRLNSSYVTLSGALCTHGYQSAHLGKWHLGPDPHSPLQFGFAVDMPHWAGPGPGSRYVSPWSFESALFSPTEPSQHIDERLAAEGVRWMRARLEAGQPFFLNFWPFSVHSPWNGKPQLLTKYKRKASKLNYSYAPEYGAMVQSLDDSVGILLGGLSALGAQRNTLVVFLSDNGGVSHAGAGTVGGKQITTNWPLREGKGSIYEGGVRVPCVVAWEGKIRAGVTDALLTAVDWMPTLLDLLGFNVSLLPAAMFRRVAVFDTSTRAPMEETTMDSGARSSRTMVADGGSGNTIGFESLLLDGVSHRSLILNEADAPLRSRVFYYSPVYAPLVGSIPSAGVRQGEWKLLRHFAAGPNGTDAIELFNLIADVSESHNVAATAANVHLVSQLNAALDQWLLDAGAPIDFRNPDFNASSPTRLRRHQVAEEHSSSKGTAHVKDCSKLTRSTDSPGHMHD